MSDRRRVSSGAKWESIVGYSRAVRVGSQIHVSWTTATDEQGRVVGPGDAYRQTVRVLEIIGEALRNLGADLRDVVRTRIYVIDIDRWEEIGRAHREALGDAGPACTMVEVQRLVSPEILVEIEADALVPD